MYVKDLLKLVYKALKPVKTIGFNELKNMNVVDSSDAGNDDIYTVHFLWVEGKLSNLELLCINSFCQNGFKVILWHYGDIINPPMSVELRDGREVIDENRIFRYSNGSLAGFADLFRYKVLSVYGGIWADTDVVCLTSKDIFSQNKLPFLVAEKLKGITKVNNNFIFWPYPQKGDFIDLAFSISNSFLPDKQRWGDCGPKLLQALAVTYTHITPSILHPEFCNPFEFSLCPNILLKPGKEVFNSTMFLHCYNETWRRENVDKNSQYTPNSILGNLSAKYLDIK